MRSTRFLWALLSLVAVTGCGDDGPSEPGVPHDSATHWTLVAAAGRQLPSIVSQKSEDKRCQVGEEFGSSITTISSGILALTLDSQFYMRVSALVECAFPDGSTDYQMAGIETGGRREQQGDRFILYGHSGFGPYSGSRAGSSLQLFIRWQGDADSVPLLFERDNWLE